VIAGTATAVSNRVSRRQANRWAQDEQSQYAEQAPPPPVADPIAQLKELSALRDQRILAEDEFTAQKPKILAEAMMRRRTLQRGELSL
jgi:hypothetical protein